MPTLKRLEEFISKVETNKHDEAIELFYTEDASMQENNLKPIQGKAILVEKEQNVLKNAKSVHSECIRPIFIKDDFAVIRWRFRFEWLDGTVSEIEEIAYQTWRQELIAVEKFFYDPSQLVHKKTVVF
jgi:RNA recognition motif-containing protein